jgi:small subunit ribosomal protein S11
MALRISRASSSTLARQVYCPLSTSTRRYQNVALPSAGVHANDGPPTSVAYPRTKTTTNTATMASTASASASTASNTPAAPNKPKNHQNKSKNNNNNPLRLDFTQHAATQLYRIHVLCTPNNTHIVISDPRGHPLKAGSWTGGSCGFKGVNRSGYEAGYQCAVRAFARIKQLAQEEGVAFGVGASAVAVLRARFEVLFSGFGQGRDAVFKALMTSEGDDVRPYVVRVTDNTPIKIGGTRAKKTRRL